MSTNSDRRSPPVPTSLATAAAWSWRLVALAGGIALVAIVLYELRIVTVPIFIALVLATVLQPPVRSLRRRGLPNALASALVFIAVIAGLVGLVYALAAPVSSEFADLGPQVSEAVDDVNSWLMTGPVDLEQAELDRYVDQAVEQVRSNSGSLRTGLVTSATLAAEVIAGFFLTLVLTFFFVKDGEELTRSLLSRFPERHRAAAAAAGDRATDTLAAYLRGIALTGVVDATLIGIVLFVVDVPLILPLVVLTFFGAFFPLVGATAAGVLAVAVALVNGGFTDALIVAVAVLVIQQVEGDVLQPLVMGRAVALHPVVILLSLATGGLIAGVLGAFLAVPLVAVTGAVTRELESRRETTDVDQAALDRLP